MAIYFQAVSVFELELMLQEASEKSDIILHI